MKPELLTLTEFCKIACVGKTKAYELINRGEVPAVKLDNKTMIRRSDVESWLSSLQAYQPFSQRG
ncbi:MAG: helix-turn-helix domain-containing protein [Rhodospirillales bacterium]|nr:helix-turn-helix domain-containing protein [Rhodospirillales bacterium]